MTTESELLKQADEYLAKPNPISYSAHIAESIVTEKLIKALADEIRGKEWQDIDTTPTDKTNNCLNTEQPCFDGANWLILFQGNNVCEAWFDNDDWLWVCYDDKFQEEFDNAIAYMSLPALPQPPKED